MVFHRIVLSCFASVWIMGGILFLTVGFGLIASGGMPIGIAIVWTSLSTVPVLIGCCLCYCFNGEKCTEKCPEKRSADISTVSIGTMTAQQPSPPAQMSPQVQLRVILLFYNLWQGRLALYNFLKLANFNFMIYFSGTKLEIPISFYSSISFKK